MGQYIYYIRFKKYIKIGRTYDLKKRYAPKFLKDNVLRVVSVNDVEEAEKAIKNSFKKNTGYIQKNPKKDF